MDAISHWSGISQKHQEQFLAQAGIDRLPAPEEISEAQWTILATVAGENVAQEIRKGVSTSLAAPRLPIPDYEGDWSAIMTKMAELQAELGNLQVKVSHEDISSKKITLQRENDRQMEKIKDCISKLAEANKSSFWGKLFGWIGTIVGVIAATLATIATGGAAAPMLAVALVGLTMMILQETGAMDKIVDWMAENLICPALKAMKFDVDKDKVKMGIQVWLAVVMLVLSITTMVASGGASASGTFGAFTKIGGIIGQGVGQFTSLGGTTANLTAGIETYETELAKASMTEDRAWITKLQQMIQEESERMQQMIEQLNQGVVNVSKMLADFADSNRKIFANTNA